MRCWGLRPALALLVELVSRLPIVNELKLALSFCFWGLARLLLSFWSLCPSCRGLNTYIVKGLRPALALLLEIVSRLQHGAIVKELT